MDFETPKSPAKFAQKTTCLERNPLGRLDYICYSKTIESGGVIVLGGY